MRCLTGALHCVLSQSHSLYLTLPTQSLSPGAHLRAAAPQEKRAEAPDYDALSARRGIREVRADQLRAAVAPLRGMCVGMATLGQRHTEGAGSARRRQGRRLNRPASGRHFQSKSTSLLFLLLKTL